MNDLLPPLPALIAFCAASLLLAVTPGPGVIYILTRTLAQGRPAGLASVAGVALGNLGNAIGAAIGLAALFAVSTLAFSIVKYAGAAYLIWLGIKTLRSRDAETQSAEAGPVRLASIFRDASLVALLNPKTAIFFAAFLPQFMSSTASTVWQSVSLGALFVLIAAITDAAYALGASAIAPSLTARRGAARWGRWLAGSAFIGLGLFSAIAGSRNAK
jgi:threonine/homoserine/homoserine lactone efflux protein